MTGQPVTGSLASRRLWLLVAIVLIAASCSSEAEQAAGDGATAQTADGAASGGEDTADAPPVSVAPAPGFDPAELSVAVDDFLEITNSENAGLVVEQMEASGERRYVAWLVDLLRLGVSNRVDSRVSAALTTLTGIESTGVSFDDANRFGSLQATEDIDPGEGYREWKIALYERLDDDFVPLLETVETGQELARIHFGGVPRAGIPELNDPVRVSAADAVWMTDDELVMGAVIDGEAVAYPLRIVLHHELVNDHIADIPVSLVYCTLCRTGLLFDRTVDGQVIEFETSGLLENSNKIMVDRQTDTLWHHLEGEGFAGPLTGTVLPQFPLVTISWADWVAEQPDTVVLAIPDPIYFDDPERPPLAYSYEPGDAYSSYYNDEDVWFPVLDTPDTFALKDQVIGVQFPDSDISLAIHLPSLLDGGARWFAAGDRSVIVVPTSAGARVFDATGIDVGDAESGAEVDAGLADGLDVVITEQSFWFAWWSNHQDTLTWGS